MNNKWELAKMSPIVKKINALRSKFQAMTDDEMRAKHQELKSRVQSESKDALLPEAFALVREATRRTLGKEHYDVQLLGGIVLHKGRIAEAKTGEGKTITIYLPAYLNALDGKGVYVVTVNDYLANRDANDARKVFEFLGMTVGCVLNQSMPIEHKLAYQCDITYVTNSELGFDYLRDHLVQNKNDLVLRGFNYAIIDEIDSILIDEAKTPLIISGMGNDMSELLQDVDDAVRMLKEGKASESTKLEKLLGEGEEETGDFIKNEKENQIYLTEQGIFKLEQILHLDNYGDEGNLMYQRAVNNALRANYMMKRDKDYIVRDDAVLIVDSFTGRVLPGRRFSDGLHQALEMKERVEVQTENVTVATVTFQAFFNKFQKKCGLTGTAMTSAKEFQDIYHLPVIAIPTNKPVIRNDMDDLVYATKKDKWNAILEETKRVHATGQPLLIGTVSIEDSEIVSDLLDKAEIPHNTLNAKNEPLEAEIISHAGEYGAVTVATNMAGRGTDIILDEKARAAGGLRVIGTERHDSRRIDNQLKGRSGRQGDPGSSQFFISLEDKVMRVFGEQGAIMMLMSMAEPGQPFNYKPLARIIEKAQQAVENENRLVRESMLKYDETNNEHREEIYTQREEIVFSDNLHEILYNFFCDVSDTIVDKYVPSEETPSSEWNVAAIVNEYFQRVAPVQIKMDVTQMKRQNLVDAFYKLNEMLIQAKEKEIGEPIFIEQVERSVILRMLDRNWTTFLTSMEYVKQHIGSEAYAQRDPAVEYKKKGVILFNQMIENAKAEIVFQFMRCHVNIQPLITPQQNDGSEETVNEPNEQSEENIEQKMSPANDEASKIEAESKSEEQVSAKKAKTNGPNKNTSKKKKKKKK